MAVNVITSETLKIQARNAGDNFQCLVTLYPKNFVTCAKSSKAKLDGASDRQNSVDSDDVVSMADDMHSAA